MTSETHTSSALRRLLGQAVSPNDANSSSGKRHESCNIDLSNEHESGTEHEPCDKDAFSGNPEFHQEISSTKKEINNAMAMNLSSLTEIDGFVGACLVDSDSGMVLGMEGGNSGLNLEMAAAGNTQVVQAKRKTMKALGLNDKIEDILISLSTQYHVIRPLESNDAIFIYVALDRAKSNLGMARMQIKGFETDLDLAA